MIEFTCLNCGMRVAVDDEDAGDQVECPGCTIMLRVPTPIGGRLTEKRLTSMTRQNPVDAPENLDPPRESNLEFPAVSSGTSGRSQRPVLPPEAPRHGFQIEYALIGVFGRNQQERLQDSMEAICRAVQQHLEASPVSFSSAGLVLEVHLFEVQIGSIDLRLQLRGSLNGSAISETILTHDSPGGSSQSVLLHGLVGIAIANVWHTLLRMLIPAAGLSRAFGRAERLAIRDISRCLDQCATSR